MARLLALLGFCYVVIRLVMGHSLFGGTPVELTPKKYSTRIVAVGDLHGDYHHTLRVLKMAGLVDHRGFWIGKKSILVQTGDIVDRGKDTILLYGYMDQLRAQAERAGGAIVSLLGNHEYMNAFGDWRYVTDEDIATFGNPHNRRRAMSSDGWIGKTWLANYSVNARVPYALDFEPYPSATSAPLPTKVGGWIKPLPSPTNQIPFLFSAPDVSPEAEEEDPFVFAAASFVRTSYGGIHPEWASIDSPVESINEIGKNLLWKATSSLISTLGLPKDTTPLERALYSTNGPLWYRGYALEEDEAKLCDQVEEVRAKLGVRRLIMGHTPNFDGIVSRCRGRVLLIDTGISRAYGGTLSALEIVYTMTPILPVIPISYKDPAYSTEQSWRESEVVSAIYENKDKMTFVKLDRVLKMPKEYVK